MKITKEGRKEKKTIIEEKKMHKQKVKEKIREKGITLIALVVTIVILLILAGVTLNIALGQNGLFSRAQNAVDRYKSAQEYEESMLAELEKQFSNLTSNQPPSPPEEDEKPLVNNLKNLQTETVEAVDKNGNPVVIPGGFRYAGGDNDTVEDGMIIEDDEGNQFVWIPVSNIDGDNNEETKGTEQKEEDLIVVDGGKNVEITLGRYTFSTDDGTPELKQAGKDYEQNVLVDSYYQETLTHTNGGEGAKDLQAFITSVQKNHGYYIGRYEASFRSGNTLENYKPAVKKSTKNSTTSMNKTSETLWNFVTEPEASTVSKNMYVTDVDDEAKYVESDLVNSYAWDTAIVYIQKMGNNNYANQKAVKNALSNTGETGDEKCHIYDMASNLIEWTTECSKRVGDTYPCVRRGGCFYYYSSDYTAKHYDGLTTYISNHLGFRPILYIK